MEQFDNESRNEKAIEKLEKATTYDDKAILDLAKRRLIIKRNLFSQMFDLLWIVLFSFFMINMYNDWDRFAVASIFIMFWALRLCFRVYKFVKPSLAEGFFAYLRERKERSLESEYNRLKKKGVEFVAAEMER